MILYICQWLGTLEDNVRHMNNIINMSQSFDVETFLMVVTSKNAEVYNVYGMLGI